MTRETLQTSLLKVEEKGTSPTTPVVRQFEILSFLALLKANRDRRKNRYESAAAAIADPNFHPRTCPSVRAGSPGTRNVLKVAKAATPIEQRQPTHQPEDKFSTTSCQPCYRITLSRVPHT